MTAVINGKISHGINSPTAMPDMVPTSRTRRSTPADRLEFSNLLRQRPLHRKPLHRRRSVEAMTFARLFHDEPRVRRLSYRPAMRQHQNFGIDVQGRRRPGVDEDRKILEFQRGLRAD